HPSYSTGSIGPSNARTAAPARTAKKLSRGAKPFAGRLRTSQSRRSPRPPSDTVPVPMPPSGRATRSEWSASYRRRTGHSVVMVRPHVQRHSMSSGRGRPYRDEGHQGLAADLAPLGVDVDLAELREPARHHVELRGRDAVAGLVEQPLGQYQASSWCQ